MNLFSKKIARINITFLLCASPALAFDRDSLIGEWGTEQQCEGELITPTGTKHATPFEIRPDWISYGDVWCRLNWATASPSSTDTFETVKALCGEDSVRDYQITFKLSDDDALTIVWNQWHKNGPLMRCPA